MNYLIRYAFAFIFVTIPICLTAQQHEIIFQQCYGGSLTEAPYDIIVGDNSYYIVAGTSSLDGDVSFNHGKSDIWLYKIGLDGTIQWQNTFGGTQDETPRQFLLTEDGGFLLFGNAWSTDGDVSGLHGGGDFWLVRTDSLGNLLWQKCLGGSCNDRPLQLIEAHGGGYICIGSTCSTDGDIAYNHGAWDAWVVRLSETGEIIWEKTYGGGGQDFAGSIAKTQDGGYILGTYGSSTDGDVDCIMYDTINVGDIRLIKIDSTGVIEWQDCYGGYDSEGLIEIEQTLDGGYVFLGVTISTGGDVSGFHGPGGDANKWDMWVVKLDATGLIEWQKCLGGYENEQAGFIEQHPDGGYLVGGNSNSTDGDINCNTSLPGTYTGWLVKLSASGEIVWQRCLGSQVHNSLRTMKILGLEHYLIAGTTRANGGDVDCDLKGQTDIWIVELQDTTVGLKEEQQRQWQLYPNPASTQTWLQLAEHTALGHVQIELYSPTGRLLHKAKPSNQYHKLEVGHLPKGLYLLRVWNGESWYVEKLVVR